MFRQTKHVLLHVGQTKPRLLFMYIKVWRENNHAFWRTSVWCFMFSLIMCFSRTKELSVFLDTFCIHWHCVVLCFEHKLGYFIIHWLIKLVCACVSDWVDLILMSNTSSTCALSNFCIQIEQNIHRYLSN